MRELILLYAVDNKTEIVCLKYDLLIATSKDDEEICSIITDLTKQVTDTHEDTDEYKNLAYALFLEYANAHKTEKLAEYLGVVEYLIPNYLSITEARNRFSECIEDLDSDSFKNRF